MLVRGVDVTISAALLRGITDELMTSAERPRPEANLPVIIAGVRATSGRATDTLRIALSAHYPNVGWAQE